VEVVLGVIALLLILIVFGKLKGPPTPRDLSDEAIMGRLQTENDWIRRYDALPQDSKKGLRQKHDEKQSYIMELMLELNGRHGQKQQESLAPVIQRTLELVRQGKAEEEAKTQALAEYVAERDARKAGSDKGVSS